MGQVILLSLVTAWVAFTLSETTVFAGLRDWAGGQSIWLEKLASYGYCLGHWVAFGLVAIYRPKLFEAWWGLDYFLTALVIAWLTAFQWASLCWLTDKAGKMERPRDDAVMVGAVQPEVISLGTGHHGVCAASARSGPSQPAPWIGEAPEPMLCVSVLQQRSQPSSGASLHSAGTNAGERDDCAPVGDKRGKGQWLKKRASTRSLSTT